MTGWENEITVKKVSDTTWRITNPTREHMFLIEGSRRAVLIDTGGGYGPLPETVASLTKLPVTLINTHAHPDHIGGNGYFQEAYLNPKDRHLVDYASSWEGRKGFMVMVRPEYEADFDKIKHVELGTDFVWHDLTEGMEFDLGGAVLRAIETPGHTEGSVSLLHVQEKTLYTGDLLAPRTVMIARGASTLARFMATLRRLQNMLPELEHIRSSHGPKDLPPECLWTLMSCCIDILNHDDAAIPTTFNGLPGFMAKPPLKQPEGFYGNILYDKDRLI